MVRIVTYFLALAALLVQLRTGALPADQMCLNFGPARATCTCCGKKAHVQVKSCCQTPGCDRCVKVPAPERQAAAGVKVRTVKASEGVITPAQLPTLEWRVVAQTGAAWRGVVTDESPPQLASIKITRLVL